MFNNQHFTVVMYHYVRDLVNSRYPAIKGLDTRDFIGQIDYLQRNYHPVTMEQVIAAYREKTALPKKAVLLTFDDGYIDHFTTVFPVLVNRGLQGSFFAPVKALTENKVLDVNKIHFILATTSDTANLIAHIRQLLDTYREEYSLGSFEAYYNRLAVANRFDTAEVIFIKRLLQVALPVRARNLIVDRLFERIVGIPEDVFSRELYMNVEQLRCMVEAGMHVGSHGFDHLWLDSLDKESQRQEIQKSLTFIKGIYGDKFREWTICYPYGAYNEDTVALLKEMECAAGFSTRVQVADLSRDSIYALPRLDTNDLPKSADV